MTGRHRASTQRSRRPAREALRAILRAAAWRRALSTGTPRTVALVVILAGEIVLYWRWPA